MHIFIFPGLRTYRTRVRCTSLYFPLVCPVSTLKIMNEFAYLCTNELRAHTTASDSLFAELKLVLQLTPCVSLCASPAKVANPADWNPGYLWLSLSYWECSHKILRFSQITGLACSLNSQLSHIHSTHPLSISFQHLQSQKPNPA